MPNRCGTGRNAAALVALQRPRSWRSSSAANVTSALRTNRAVPSGWWQAPRPVTSPAQRSTSARDWRRGRAPASSVSAAAIRGSPFRQGPHWPADSSARYRTTRAVSASPHRSDGKVIRIPAPTRAPALPSDLLSSVSLAASAAGTQVP